MGEQKAAKITISLPYEMGEENRREAEETLNLTSVVVLRDG